MTRPLTLKADTRFLCWLDLESTGSTTEDPILEVAVVLTDWSLRRIDWASHVVDPSPDDWMRRLEKNPKVMDMHVKNGLVGDILAGRGSPINVVEQELIVLLEQHGGPHSYALAGSGVAMFDRAMLGAQMPKFERFLAYPMIDMGDIRRFVGKTCGREDLLLEVPDKNHRALDDIEMHIAEAEHFRDVFKTIP